MDKIELSPDIFNTAKWASAILTKQGLKTTYEIYRLSVIEQAMTQEDLEAELTDGLVKPWEIPVAYIKDANNNIVLFRCKEIEDYLKEHSSITFYSIPKLKDGTTFQVQGVNMLYIVGEPYWKAKLHEGPTDDLPF